MPTRDAILETKRRISTALLGTPGISGVGLRGGRVVIYVENADSSLRQHANAVAKEIAPDVSLLFEHAGTFRKQG